MHPPASSQSTQCVLRWTGCFFLFLAVLGNAYAQIEDRVWFGTGLGLGAMFENEENDNRTGAFAGPLYASYQTGAHVFSVRGVAVTELLGDTASDLGVLYGRSTTGPNGHASFGIGLAAVFVDYTPDDLDLDLACILIIPCLFEDPDDIEDIQDEDRDENVRTFGVPVEVQLYWRPLAYLGLGVYGFANLNPEASFVGLAFGLQLGDLR